jgi:hypothetical protein
LPGSCCSTDSSGGSRSTGVRGAWKFATFAIGLAWLLWGATFWSYPDWDYGVSLLMAGSTYLSADWAVAALLERKYRRWPAAVLFAWWCVDGSYLAYWSAVNPSVMIREGQWAMSLCLFLLCGLIWRIDPRVVLTTVRTRCDGSRPDRTSAGQ